MHNILQQLKAGKAETLEKDLEARIPELAIGVPKLVENPQRLNQILWAVQRFYVENQVPVPEQLRPLLESLPPRPPTSCDIKRGL